MNTPAAVAEVAAAAMPILEANILATQFVANAAAVSLPRARPPRSCICTSISPTYVSPFFEAGATSSLHQ